MTRYILSPAAEQDIEEIIDYIAKDNLTAALDLLDHFYKSMDQLAEFPQIGHSRLDLTPQPVRFWPVNRYLIIYKETNPLEIVRLLSSYRDITQLLF